MEGWWGGGTRKEVSTTPAPGHVLVDTLSKHSEDFSPPQLVAFLALGFLGIVIILVVIKKTILGRIMDMIIGRPLDEICLLLQAFFNRLSDYVDTMWPYAVRVYKFARRPACNMDPFRWDRQDAAQSFIYFNTIFAILAVPMLLFDASSELDTWMRGVNFHFSHIFGKYTFNRWLLKNRAATSEVVIHILEKFLGTFLVCHGGWYTAEYCRFLLQGEILMVWALVYFEWNFILSYQTPLFFVTMFCALLMAITGGECVFERVRECLWGPSGDSYEPCPAEQPNSVDLAGTELVEEGRAVLLQSQENAARTLER